MQCSSRNVLVAHQEDSACILTPTTKTALTTGKGTGTVGMTAIQAPTMCTDTGLVPGVSVQPAANGLLFQ